MPMNSKCQPDQPNMLVDGESPDILLQQLLYVKDLTYRNRAPYTTPHAAARL
jgi:hypothetical protein